MSKEDVDEGQWSDLAKAIVRAVVYADLFDFPIAVDELHQQLPLVTASRAEVLAALDDDPNVTALVTKTGELVHLKGREALIARRSRQEQKTDALVDQHLGMLQLLSGLPWVRMVAFSGGTSRKNSITDDDIDLFIVTAPNRAWAVHALLVASSRALGCRDVLCANYIVDEDHISVPDRGDLFTGHEMSALRPLVGEDMLHKLFGQNDWVQDILPNATPNPPERLWHRPDWHNHRKMVLETSLWPIGLLMEHAARVIFGARLRNKAARSSQSDVLLRAGLLKLHTHDNRATVVERFRDNLEQMGLWTERLGARMSTRDRR